MSDVPNATKEWHDYHYHLDTCKLCLKGKDCGEADELLAEVQVRN